jgi:hypothetical protein
MVSKVEKKSAAKIARPAATLFIAFHIIAIAFWVFPLNASLTRLVRRSIGPYFTFIGLRQEWSLFAPEPIAANSYVDAEVTFANGDRRNWSFPRLETLGFRERYSKASYRKYTGWLYRPAYKYAWPDAARYVARQFRYSISPPATVQLVRHWAGIPAIGSAGETLPAWQNTVFFVYRVLPGDLP